MVPGKKRHLLGGGYRGGEHPLLEDNIRTMVKARVLLLGDSWELLSARNLLTSYPIESRICLLPPLPFLSPRVHTCSPAGQDALFEPALSAASDPSAGVCTGVASGRSLAPSLDS